MEKVVSLWKTILYCLRLSWKSSKYYTLVRLIGNVANPLILIVSSYLLKYILDILSGITSYESKTQGILICLGILLVVKLLSEIIRNCVSYVTSIHNDILQNTISQMMLEKAVDADISLYDNPKYYDSFTAMQRDASALSGILWVGLDCISALVSCAGAFLVLGQKNLLFAIIITVLSIPSAIFTQQYTKLLYQYDLKQITNMRQRNYLFQIGSIKEFAQEVRCYQLGEILKQKYDYLFKFMFYPKKRLLKRRSILTEFFCMLSEITVIFLSVQIAFGVIRGTYTIGDYSWYTNMIAQIAGSITILTNYLANIYDNKIRIENMKKFDQFSYNNIESGKREIKHINKIEFRNVTFSYPSTKKCVLNQISFIIKDKEKTALVGVNGSGKSTLIKLLLRLYDVTEGEILINDINIKEYNLTLLRECCGIYFQNGMNLEFTLRDNITLMKEQNDEKCINVLTNCAGTDILNKCTDNMDTYIGRMFSESGIELSIGQKQKIALARALYGEKSLYILDEPSSSLDPEAEDTIFNYIGERCQNRLVLFTSHRLSSVHLADKIIVIEAGKIVEQGTPKDLLNNQSRFSELYHHQTEKYKTYKE